MANKIFRNLKPQAHLSRNGFDKSFLHNFTAKIGELLPVACVETVPGGHYEFKVSDFLRTIPMNNAAFIRATQHFELYFVPYKQLWHYWDDFYTTRGVPQSTVLSRKNFKGAPNMYLANIFDETLDAKVSQYQTPYFMDVFGNPAGYGMDKIENLLGYRGSYGLTPNDTVRFGDLRPNVFRAAAYQKICFDYYRQPYYDLPDDFTAYQFNLDDCGESGSVDAAITIDNVTVPRSNLLFRLNYRQWKKDLFTGTLPSTQFGAVSVVDVSGGKVEVDESVLDDVSTQSSVLDSVFYKSNHNPATGVLNSDTGNLIIGNSVSVGVGNDYHSHSITAEDLAGSLGNGALTSANGTFDILSLVRASAIQQWRENTLRAGFRNTSQYQGHFGVTPIFTDKDKCVFIDSVSSPLMVNSVTNTSAQGDVALGDTAANAKSSLDGRKMKFDAKDFGVLMCIYSMLPEASYTSLSLEPMNAKVERDDFFTPEYENIGLQPMSNIFANLVRGASVNSMGYVPRYAEYKIGIDRNSAEFSDIGINTFMGAFAGWSPNRYVPSEMSIGDFYVNPEYYSDIFVVKPTPQSNTDTFIHQCYFDIKCVLPMSVLGLPNY